VSSQRHAPAVLYSREDPVPILQEAGWAPAPVWTGAENIAPNVIRSPDCQTGKPDVFALTEVPGREN